MKRSFLKKVMVFAAGAALGLQLSEVSAQTTGTWPVRPVRIVVPFPAGGATDLIARSVGERMSTELGQPFVIENRPGAGGMIAAETVSRAAADGYTLLLGTNSSLVTNRYLYPKLTYNPDQFELLGLVGITPLVLLSNPSVPAKTLPELVAYARANPGKLTYASFGNGTTSHLAGELFKQMANVDIVHVPYKGAAEAIPALLGGQVSLYFDTIVTSLPHVKSGKLRALGVTTARRSAIVPELPTIAEQGFPGYELYPWYGLVAPKGTPREVLEKLRASLNHSLGDAQFQQKMVTIGAELNRAGPAEFAELIRFDATRTEKLVRTLGMATP